MRETRALNPTSGRNMEGPVWATGQESTALRYLLGPLGASKAEVIISSAERPCDGAWAVQVSTNDGDPRLPQERVGSPLEKYHDN